MKLNVNQLYKAYLAVKELGLKQLVPYAAYRFRLQSGILQHATPPGGWPPFVTDEVEKMGTVPFPNLSAGDLKQYLAEPEKVIHEADELCAGWYKPFGGAPARLDFTLNEIPLKHWSRYGSTFGGTDIKLIWEPARFTWVYALLEAYILTGDEKYPSFFWQQFNPFIRLNPVNTGPNWSSAQEVALRLLPLLFAWQTFKPSPVFNSEKKKVLIHLIEQSARRITFTLDYARSQNNNHLLSEAVGLILAGTFFDRVHPQAAQWTQTGFHAFEEGVMQQIEPDGSYSQHSTNYHRLMLQLALVYYIYAQYHRREVMPGVARRLAAATTWLAEATDPPSGRMINLGHNDGSLLLPQGIDCFQDARPTLQAASRAFLGKSVFPPGEWDLLSRWLGIPTPETGATMDSNPSSASLWRVGEDDCWGTLRAVRFHSRPAHADQLAVDLWWHGTNFAMDAGTYLYNGAPPWENALAATCVHNTITLDGRDQMSRAGRFLWLDRVNAAWLPQSDVYTLAAWMVTHTRPPLRQQRSLIYHPGDGFTVMDEITPLRTMAKPMRADIQWLLPDWEYQLLPNGIKLTKSGTTVSLVFEWNSPGASSCDGEVTLIRAGETLSGTLINPIRGWVSSTYAQKSPALSISVSVFFRGPLRLVSRWKWITSGSETG